MKKMIVFLIIMGAITLNVSWMMEGCTGKIAPMAALIPTAAPTLGANVVSNFEDQSSNLNSNLFHKAITPAPVTFLPGNLNPTAPAPNIGVWVALPAGNFISPGGANGTAIAGHITTGPTPTPMAGYTPFQLSAVPNPTGSYDISPASGATFTGIQFYWKTGINDNMGGRWFICPVAHQLPPPEGDCSSGPSCYDTFKTTAGFLGNTGGLWQLITVPFSSLNQGGWGIPQVGSLTGSYQGISNLSQIEYFKWEEDPNNISNNYTVDFWVDEISLY